MATFAFIESNTTGTGQLLARKARDKGYRVLFLSRDPGRYPYLLEEMIHPVVLNTHDKDEVTAYLRGVDDLAGVFSSSEYFLETAAYAARELDLPGADPEAVAACRDKWLLARTLEQAGLAAPRTIQVCQIEEAASVFKELGAPVVVKPVSGSGSIGVQMHRSPADFQNHLNELLGRTTNERGQQVAPRALVQSYVDGDEYSVEMIGLGKGYQVLGITRKYLGEPPYFVEAGHDFPADLAPARQEAVISLVQQSLDAMGLTFGPSHTEVRFNGEEPMIIEINPRLAGGMIPVLMETALEMDLLGNIIDLYTGSSEFMAVGNGGAASIGFLIPPEPGILERVTYKKTGHALQVTLTRKVGEPVVRAGDFRDRIGFVIMAGHSPEESRSRLNQFLADGEIVVKPSTTGGNSNDGADTGRLKQTLHPEAMTLVRKPPSEHLRRRELAFLAQIDEAHLLMLGACKILPQEKIQPVLSEIRNLKSDGFAALADKIAPRGIYLLYENELIARLGIDLGGVAHTGRSRNDINACLFRLKLRKNFEEVYRALWRLRSELVRRADGARDLVMPVYSQFQPGLPGTLAYYLLSVEEALSRDQTALQQTFDQLNTSPMGAGAGAGTGFPINPSQTAALLGFETICNSALDAVASRDLALRLLGAVSVSGMHISRLAQDFQLWCTQEFSFLELPDNLAGGSSMMPQKKNPYLLEMIKGRAVAPSGQWSTAMATMQKTPFCNSVEVGTEAVAGLEKALTSFNEAAILMSLIVAGADPNPKNMERAAEKGVVIAACVSDWMVREQGIAFREAHHRVGAAISQALESDGDPNQALLDLVPEARHDLATWAATFDYGGGPGPRTTAANSERAHQRLAEDASWLQDQTAPWALAHREREEAVAEFLRGEV